MTTIRFVGAALLAASLASFAHAASVLPDGAQVIDVERVPTEVAASAGRRAAAALSHIRAGDPAAAIAQLSGLAPLQFEPAAAHLLSQLQADPRTPAAERVMDWIAQQPVRLYQRHDETRSDWFLPVYDVPARVESVRRLWTMAEQRADWRLRWEADAAATLAALPALDADQRQRAVEAVAELAPARFDAVRSVVGAQIDKRAAVPADVVVAIARHAPDHASLTAALETADAAALLDLVPVATATLRGDAAIAWLDALAHRHPALASAATLALAPLTEYAPKAEQRLVELLADPQRGASAAAALARLPRAQRVEWIDAAIAREARPQALARLLLALRLEGSEAALASERRWREDPRVRGLLPAEALQ